MARFIENEMGVMMIGEAFEGLHDNAEKREQRLFEMVYRIFDAKTNAMEAIQDHLKLGKWTYTYGDRASELVLIGVNLNHAAIRGALEGALLTKAEMSSGVESWERFLPSHHRPCPYPHRRSPGRRPKSHLLCRVLISGSHMGGN